MSGRKEWRKTPKNPGRGVSHAVVARDLASQHARVVYTADGTGTVAAISPVDTAPLDPDPAIIYSTVPDPLYAELAKLQTSVVELTGQVAALLAERALNPWRPRSLTLHDAESIVRAREQLQAIVAELFGDVASLSVVEHPGGTEAYPFAFVVRYGDQAALADEDLYARHSALLDRYIGEVSEETRQLIDFERVIEG